MRWRRARSVSDESTGCCVVFWSAKTHLPSSLRSFAASAAAASAPSVAPASCFLSETTGAEALLSASSFSSNAVVRRDSSSLSAMSVFLSASERSAPARTNVRL